MFFLVHAASFWAPSALAQVPSASPRGGYYLRLGVSELLEGRAQTPLFPTGPTRSIAAGLIIPGVWSYAAELGVRAFVVSPDADLRNRRAMLRGVALEGGPRVVIDEPWEAAEVFVAGGLHLTWQRDREFFKVDPRLQRGSPTDRLTLGPRLLLGLSQAFADSMRVAIAIEGRANIVPAAIDLGVVVEVTAFD